LEWKAQADEYGIAAGKHLWHALGRGDLDVGNGADAHHEILRILFDSAQPNSKHSRIIPAPFDESAEAINRDYNENTGRTERVRLGMDIIASLTEQQAVAFHQRLLGVAPGSILDRIVKS
jgi:hypothetical protein